MEPSFKGKTQNIGSSFCVILSYLIIIALDEDNAKYTEAWNTLKSVQGILVPGGFGDRGVEVKILAANYARSNKIPYLGICLGMQVSYQKGCNQIFYFFLGSGCNLSLTTIFFEDCCY